MSSRNWDPLRDILNVSDRMNRLFQDSFNNEGTGQWQPPVDIYENADEIVILAEIPGLSEEDIDIQVNNGLLVIKGEKQAPAEKDSENYYRLERPFGKFVRSFTVPNTIDISNVSASLKNGVLTINLKKGTQAKTVTVKVVKED